MDSGEIVSHTKDPRDRQTLLLSLYRHFTGRYVKGAAVGGEGNRPNPAATGST